MGMFCNFFAYSKDLESIKDIILNVIVKEEIVRLHDEFKNVIIDGSGQDDFDIIFDAFSATIDFLDKEDIELISGQYRSDFNFSIYLRIMHTVPDYDHQIMKFIGCIMQRIDSDCAFEDNGDALLLRKAGEIIIDESWSSRLVPFPYEELGLSYSKGTIVLY